MCFEICYINIHLIISGCAKKKMNVNRELQKKNDYKVISIRVQTQIYLDLKIAAEAMNRSVNQELCTRLAHSLLNIKRVLNKNESVLDARTSESQQFSMKIAP